MLHELDATKRFSEQKQEQELQHRVVANGRHATWLEQHLSDDELPVAQAYF